LTERISQKIVELAEYGLLKEIEGNDLLSLMELIEILKMIV
jgi:hypothetical protein